MEAVLSVKIAVPIPPALVALIVIEEVPDIVGVPEMIPVFALTASPGGKPVAP